MYVASQGDDKIVRFAMDAATGALEPQGEVVVPGGPAPIAVDPGRQWLYVARRGECKISSYRIDQRTGALGLLGTVELPTDPCYLATDRRGKFLLADPDRAVREIFVCPNRGHNSIAGFAVDAATGLLRSIGQAASEPVPRAFSLDPEGKFLYAAGLESGRLAAYRIDPDTGMLQPLTTYPIGKRPMWVMIIKLPA